MVTEVLLAVYNGAAYLPALLASIAAQTESGFHVLMQDDGSSDDSPALLAGWQARDTRFSVVEDVSNRRVRGAIGNFWSLLGQARGAYTALADQDDCWHPNRLRDGLRTMTEAESCWGKSTPLLVHSDARVVDAQGRVLHASLFAHQGWDPAAVSLPRLLVQNNVTGCTVLINRALRELALAHGDPRRMHMHDWFLALTAAAFGHIIFLPVPEVDYRQHGDNAMGASAEALPRRGVQALSAREKGRARIALTYRHTRAFLEAYRGCLPSKALDIVQTYLALEHQSKPARIRGIIRGGYWMQSLVTRAGQLFFS